MSEKYWYLKRCDLFERLTDEQIHRLESRSRVRSFPARTTVYLPSDPGDSVFLLTHGRAKISYLTPNGKQSILAFIEPGELFGELAIIEPVPRDEFVETLQPSTVVMIPADEMRRLMEAHSGVALGITRLIGLRRKRIEQRLKNLLFRSNRERLTHLLLELAERYGSPNGHGIVLSIRLSHQDLANVIGSARETVTVALSQMQTEGLIDVKRRTIALVDAQRLARSVASSVPGRLVSTRPSLADSGRCSASRHHVG